MQNKQIEITIKDTYVLQEQELECIIIGIIVEHPDDGQLILITHGQYESNGGISNYWNWRRVLPDGTISDTEEGGYGWRPKRWWERKK